MTKKIVKAIEETQGISLPDFTSVIADESLTMTEKRQQILESLGLRRTKKKYPTTEARKAAAKVRAKERREERTKALAQYGLEPTKLGPKRTEEEKKVARTDRGKRRRLAFKEMATAQPDLAKKYGFDPKKFRL